MDIFGKSSTDANPFDQELNTTDVVTFASASVAAAPTAADQLTNKSYVDGGGSGGPYLPLTGGTMTGTLNAPAFAVTGGNSAEFLKADGTTDANTYLTTADAGTTYLPLAGGTLTGELTASAGVNASTVLTVDIRPAAFSDMNVGLMNVDILRLGGNGVFLQGGDMTGVQILTANTFIKTGGVDTQYLMADGSTLTRSANSGNSNFYLYNSKNGAGGPPIANGDIEYNDAVQGAATTIWISHRTRDLVDIDIFFPQINSITQVYLQDQENSTNFIRYGVTGVPSIVINDYVAVPVVAVESGGTGATSFGAGHNILMVIFTDGAEVDVRLTTLEDKTQNQTAVPGTTTFAGAGGVVASALVKVGGTASQFLKADGSVDSNAYLTPTQGGVDNTYFVSKLFFVGATITQTTAYLPTGALLALGGATTAVTQSATNSLTKILRVNTPTSSTADGQDSGYQGTTLFPKIYIGAGFCYSMRFGISDTITRAGSVCQMFHGFGIVTSALGFGSTLGPNGTQSIVGVGCDITDTVLSFYSKGTSTANPKIPTTFSCATPSLLWFSLTIFNQNNSNVVYVTLVEVTSNVSITQSFTMTDSTHIVNTALLFPIHTRAMGSPSINGSAQCTFQSFNMAIR